jgi:hypothetical protein
MAVDMIHRLPAVGLAVDHEAGAFFGTALVCRQFLGLVEEPPQEGRVALFQFHHIGNVPLGNHQKMYRRLGVYIVEGKKFVILVDFFAGYIPLYYSAENTISHNSSAPFSMGIRLAACFAEWFYVLRPASRRKP